MVLYYNTIIEKPYPYDKKPYPYDKRRYPYDKGPYPYDRSVLSVVPYIL